jgi:hypothetical protein
MVWMAVVGNEDLQNRRFPAALGVICASDLNKPETRVLSPQKQQEINNINQQFVNIQNTQINDIDNIINVINTVTTTTTTAITPPPGQNGTGAGTTTLAAAPVQQDTTPPTLIGPEDVVTEPFSELSGVLFYTVTAQDNVDGTAKLEPEDGITVPVLFNPVEPAVGGANDLGMLSHRPAGGIVNKMYVIQVTKDV